MIYSNQTTGSIEETVEKLKQSASRNQFGVLGIHDLKEKMAAKGITFGCECRIMDVCNPNQAKKVLEANINIATTLPCRIAVWQDNEKVRVAAIKPTVLLDMFESPQLEPVAKEVEQTIIRIIDEACK
jgi:uncharacterized protein (DUF302 family)